jgi:hypothetical protein
VDEAFRAEAQRVIIILRSASKERGTLPKQSAHSPSCLPVLHFSRWPFTHDCETTCLHGGLISTAIESATRRRSANRRWRCIGHLNRLSSRPRHLRYLRHLRRNPFYPNGLITTEFLVVKPELEADVSGPDQDAYRVLDAKIVLL